jgi:hypothetical protein
MKVIIRSIFIAMIFCQNAVITVSSDDIGACEKHQDLIHIAGALLHIPSIVTVDSKNEENIRTWIALATLPTNINLGVELVKKKNTRLIKELVYDLPKVCAHLLAVLYDITCFIGADKLAKQNEIILRDDEYRFCLFKASQFIKLFTEILLRVWVYKNADRDKGEVEHHKLSSVASVAADVVQCWRLLERWKTCFAPFRDSNEVVFENFEGTFTNTENSNLDCFKEWDEDCQELPDVLDNVDLEVESGLCVKENSE